MTPEKRKWVVEEEGGHRLDTDWQLLSRLHPQFTTDIRLLPPQKFSSDFAVELIYIK